MTNTTPSFPEELITVANKYRSALQSCRSADAAAEFAEKNLGAVDALKLPVEQMLAKQVRACVLRRIAQDAWGLLFTVETEYKMALSAFARNADPTVYAKESDAQ